MKESSYIELSKSALKKNIRYLKHRIGPKSKFISVVKGNAYGHGLEQFVPLAEECGVDHFAVFDCLEAERVYNKKKKTTELMIMGMIDSEDLKWAIEQRISFFVFDLFRLEKAILAARLVKEKARIHIELETGLNRTGFEREKLEKVRDLIISNMDVLEIEGICTHLAGAESIANFVRIENQLNRYRELCNWFKEWSIIPKAYHVACSAAALTYPETQMDAVRFGISQYGFWPSHETRMHNLLSDNTKFLKDPLKRILSWKSYVMSVKTVKAGKFIGYGTSYMTNKSEKFAVIPVGYSAGFGRNLSNLGSVLIRGKLAPIAGMVNMNMIIANVSTIPEVKKGDTVVIIGSQRKKTISVTSFADLSRYVNYEMLTRLPERIPRIIVN